MANKTQTDREINPIIGIQFVVIAAVLFGIAIFFFNSLNSKRNAQVVTQYTAETNEYIARNKKGLTFIFSNLFLEGKKCNAVASEKMQSCKQTVSAQIHGNLDDDIKDYSSMMFIALDPTSREVSALQLSGELRTGDMHTDSDRKVRTLLEGNADQIEWDDYFYQFSNNEVIVPVTIDGKRVGAIVRGVIED